MKKCPWCGSKVRVKKCCVGYFCECTKNSHVHNVGVFKNAKSFCETEAEATKEWNKAVEQMNL